MGLSAIRTGARNRLATIEGLTALDKAPASLPPAPVATVLPAPGGGTYDLVGGGGSVRHTLVVTVYVSLAAGPEQAQEELDAYIAPTGTKSVKAAIESEPTLGGTVEDCRVRRYYDYLSYDYAGTKYLGVKFDIDALEG